MLNIIEDIVVWIISGMMYVVVLFLDLYFNINHPWKSHLGGKG